MTEKLRRIESMHDSFEWSKEELESLSLWQAFSKEIEGKQKLAERVSQKWLHGIYKAEHVQEMVYPKELTKLLDGIKDALIGKDAHKSRYYAPYREKHQGKRKYSKKWIQHQNLETLLKELSDLSRNKKARRIINDHKRRLECFTDPNEPDVYFDKKAGRLFKLLHELKGTKLDWIGVGERCDKCGERKIAFYDSKYWDETKYKKPSVKWKDLKHYVGFSKKGIPYHLLFFNVSSEALFGCEIKSLPIPDNYEDMDDEEYYQIDRKYLYPLWKKDSGEKPSSI